MAEDCGVTPAGSLFVRIFVSTAYLRNAWVDLFHIAKTYNIGGVVENMLLILKVNTTGFIK